MSWVGPVAKGVAKYGVKYGPQAKILWDNGGKHAQEVARERVRAMAARRTAFEKAETVVAGSVLKQIYSGKQVWVVFSGDEPVDAFPGNSVDLGELVKHADLSARVTPEEHRGGQLRQRALQIRERRGRA
jgi:hypothetical protein